MSWIKDWMRFSPMPMMSSDERKRSIFPESFAEHSGLRQ